MKNYLNALIAILTIALFTTSCVDRKFDNPKLEIPSADTSNGTVITIDELLSLYLSPNAGTATEIDSNIYVRGIVTANDVSGNLYKQIFIQDETRGINIQIDKTSLFTIFPVGQMVYLRCKGFYVGNYSTIPQFGYVYKGAPGRIPTHLVDSAIMVHGLPKLSQVPQPKSVNSIAAGAFTANDVNKLVQIKNVSFVVTAGKEIYAVKNEVYPERTVQDAAGNQMILSTSWYANFAADTIPVGVSGDITGILTVFSGANRLLIRDINDVAMYNVISSSKFDVSPTDWTTKSITGTDVWTYNSTDKCMKINGYAGLANEDWLISPQLDLSNTLNPILSFSSRRRFADTEVEPLQVLISTNYSGDVSTATWTVLTDAFFDQNSTSAFTGWAGSGDVDISSYKVANVRIAFRYKTNGNPSGTASYWDIDNVNIND